MDLKLLIKAPVYELCVQEGNLQRQPHTHRPSRQRHRKYTELTRVSLSLVTLTWHLISHGYPEPRKGEGQFPFLSFFIFFLSTLVDKSNLRIHHKIYICGFSFLLIIYLQLFNVQYCLMCLFLDVVLCTVVLHRFNPCAKWIHRMVPCEVTYRHNWGGTLERDRTEIFTEYSAQKLNIGIWSIVFFFFFFLCFGKESSSSSPISDIVFQPRNTFVFIIIILRGLYLHVSQKLFCVSFELNAR